MWITVCAAAAAAHPAGPPVRAQPDPRCLSQLPGARNEAVVETGLNAMWVSRKQVNEEAWPVSYKAISKYSVLMQQVSARERGSDKGGTFVKTERQVTLIEHSLPTKETPALGRSPLPWC